MRREIRETQNGGDPVDAATIATQNRSSAASMVMFLLSDVMKVRNRVKRAFRQSKTYGSKVLAAEAVGALAKAYAVKYLGTRSPSASPALLAMTTTRNALLRE